MKKDKLVLQGVSKRYGATTALRAVDLTIKEGEFVTLLGPSGSGKSTLLKIVAGMILGSEGTIRIDGRDSTKLDARKRDLGMVFQNYALMPHMTVADNVAFPLAVRGETKAASAAKVRGALEKVRLAHLADRMPQALSGGQQQRVAIARAIVYNPSLVLMDEPLGALDKKLREQLQYEIMALHRDLGITVLYVTHDQSEAMAMSDRVVLMNNGGIEQEDPPEQLYARPRTRFTADFLGESNFLEGRVTGSAQGGFLVEGTDSAIDLPVGDHAQGTATLLTRPEHVKFSADIASGPVAQIRARAVSSTFFGGSTHYLFEKLDATAGSKGALLKSVLLNDGNAPSFTPGQIYSLYWNRNCAVVLTR